MRNLTWLLAAVLVAGASARSASGEATPTVRVIAEVPEEVLVTESRLEPGQVVPYEDMQLIHDMRSKGGCLYRRGDYEEAFPYLMAAAKRGFKMAQARVGFLHQKGLGTERDPYAAVAWLAVAADGRTHPEIQHYFNDVWKRIPEEYLPGFQAVTDEYRSKYGSRRHRVNCDFSSKAGTHFKKLTCRFQDEAMHVDWGPLIGMLMSSGQGGIADPFPTSNPVRPNRTGC